MNRPIFSTLLVLLVSAVTLKGGTIVGVVNAKGAPEATESGGDGAYSSRRYKFAEKLDYDQLTDFVISVDEAPATLSPGTTPAAITTQRNAVFEPHVLPVAVGTSVKWPNLDSIYHNVFSMSEPKVFNLGLYHQERVPVLTFDKPGRVDVFCAIHSQMHCIILVLPNQFFAKADANQRYVIKDVPAGTYKPRAWHERMPSQVKEVVVPADGEVRVDFTLGLAELPKIERPRMSQPEKKLRFSFQTKVLVPVLAALILLPAVTLWIVDRSISNQMQKEAGHTLTTAETLFRQTLDFRARDLLTRFRYAVNEPSYRSIAQIAGSHDPLARDSVSKFLFGQLDAYGEDYEALLITAMDNTSQVAARSSAGGTTEGWAKITAPLTSTALQGEAMNGTLEFSGRVYLVVSVPVFNPDGTSQAGALTVATRISEAFLQELKSLTGAEILLIAGNAITASSLHQPDLPALQPMLAQSSPASELNIPVEIHNEHYLALTNSYGRGDPHRGFRYILLSSYEQRLGDLNATRATLLGVSFAGILLSGLFVWFLIRRITHPLVELRDNAEAVGRGDFTRRIDRFSNDECGAVAVAFNSMTDNLQASRADLEKAVGSLKTTQAQLIQSEKLSAVGQFVAGVAHELNNPLTSVIGFADLLQHQELDPKFQGYVGHIAKNATRCHKIVNSLLGFSRQHEPERKPVKINELADAVIEIIAYDLRTSNITLVREYSPDLPLILGDSHQLQQVILNIISNARQAVEAFRRDGEIVIRTGCTDTQVWMRIKDNGPGIPRDILSRIFDPFFTTKPQGKGTGLGLSLSYGIMQEHRGRIAAESQPGEGTEFILELPIADPGPALAAIRPASVAPFKARVPSLAVLVIDDEQSIRHLVREVLRSEGHRVETAGSGEAALELIKSNHYDVIISDWKMPGLNGINLFQELLVKNPAAAKRMLFMTGDVIKESFQDFLKKHARTCLPKPFALREFHAAIAKIVNLN